MKKNIEEGKIGNERYKIMVFAIFKVVVSSSNNGIISLEVGNAFIEY